MAEPVYQCLMSRRRVAKAVSAGSVFGSVEDIKVIFTDVDAEIALRVLLHVVVGDRIMEVANVQVSALGPRLIL
jgi:hypothetical protein